MSQKVDVRITAHTVEIFHKHRRVVAHLPDPQEGRIRNRGFAHTGRPRRPRGVDSVTPHRLGPQGRDRTRPRSSNGSSKSRTPPRTGLPQLLGLMRLLRAYPAERLEAACRLALEIGTVSYRSVNSILATGRDQTAAVEQRDLSLPAEHAHICGPGVAPL